MKKLILGILSMALLTVSCVQEPAIEPSAKFNTKLVDGVAFAGETFYIYLDGAKGDFYALYRGFSEATTYDENDPSRTGENISTDTDSVGITFQNAGEYTVTLVATSTGNWAEDILRDVYSLTLNVMDNRAEILSMEVDRRDGVITEDNEILFYAHKLENLTNLRVRFRTASPEAEVYVGDELQEDAKNRHDFSAVNPDDNEGRPVVYEVVAPDGSTKIYVAKFILRDPSSEKIIYSLESSDFLGTLTLREADKEVLVEYYAGDELDVELEAEVSIGAIAEFDGKEISDGGGDVNLLDDPTILVTAEDLSTLEYTLVFYEKERIDTFSFIGIEDEGSVLELVPNLFADITFESRTLTMEVPNSLDLSSLVSTFAGIDDFTLTIEDTDPGTNDAVTLEEGVTPFDYSFDAGMTSKDFLIKTYDGDTLIDTYTLTVTY